jgi:hypothetical protein
MNQSGPLGLAKSPHPLRPKQPMLISEPSFRRLFLPKSLLRRESSTVVASRQRTAKSLVSVFDLVFIAVTDSQAAATQPDVDGFLVGGASLKPEFVDIVNAKRS